MNVRRWWSAGRTSRWWAGQPLDRKVTILAIVGFALVADVYAILSGMIVILGPEHAPLFLARALLVMGVLGGVLLLATLCLGANTVVASVLRWRARTSPSPSD